MRQRMDSRQSRGTWVVALGLTLVAGPVACGSMGDSTSPEDEATPVAVEYSMTSSEFLPHSELPPNLLLVMGLRNVSAATVDRSYPAGCPVRIRIYRTLDSALLYDETRLACALTDPASMRLVAGESRTIGSGFRQMTQIMGDSIPCGTYRVVGVPQTEGSKVIEVEAGEATLRAYPAWPAPNANAVYQC